LTGSAEASPPPLFDQPFYEAITEARLAHLATLELPIEGRSVIDIGCGIGRLSEFFAERRCEVLCVDGRQENISRLREVYPGRRAAVVDVEQDSLTELGEHDIVFCYGLLYHLADPFAFIRRAAGICRETMLIETCVVDALEELVLLVEDPDDATQALSRIASRPSPSFVSAALRSSGLEHVYLPRERPRHPDFQYRRLLDGSYFRDGRALREVFVASRVPLSSTALEPFPPSALRPSSG